MPVPLFGWSAGDIVVSIQILYRVAEAFHDSGGASDQHKETSAWLQSFADDLERYIKDHINSIDPHYVFFEQYLRRYDSSLKSNSEALAIRKAFKKIKWALKELHGRVEHLKRAVTGPLMSINLLLSLQTIHDVDEISRELKSTAQASRLDALGRNIDTLGLKLHTAEYRLVDLQNSIEAQKTTIKNLRILVDADTQISLKGFCEAQEGFTIAVQSAIKSNSTEVVNSLSRVGDRLADLIKTISASSDNWKAAIDDQRMTIQVCQMHWESIHDKIDGIGQGCHSNQGYAATHWTEGLRTAALVTGTFLGVLNTVSIARIRPSVTYLSPQARHYQEVTDQINTPDDKSRSASVQNITLRGHGFDRDSSPTYTRFPDNTMDPAVQILTRKPHGWLPPGPNNRGLEEQDRNPDSSNPSVNESAKSPTNDVEGRDSSSPRDSGSLKLNPSQDKESRMETLRESTAGQYYPPEAPQTQKEDSSEERPSGRKTYEWFWICCQCPDMGGPYRYDITLCCVCSHELCKYCTMERVLIRDLPDPQV